MKHNSFFFLLIKSLPVMQFRAIYAVHTDILRAIPGGVPQHMLRSSMSSTSRPINHAPRDTSSLAYLCNMGLQ